MGLACPIHLQSPRVTRQLLTVPVSPVCPRGWQSHTVLLWAFPCHSGLRPMHPVHPTDMGPHTPGTPHPMLPSPNNPCNQHRAHAAPSACSTQTITPYTQRPHTRHMPHHQHPAHPMKGTLHTRSWSLGVFLLPHHPVPHFVLPDAELLGSPSDLCPPLACFPSPAGPDAKVRGMAALPLCSGSVLADGHRIRSSPRPGWAQSTGAGAFGGSGCPYPSGQCFRDPPVTAERGPSAPAPACATVDHDSHGASVSTAPQIPPVPPSFPACCQCRPFRAALRPNKLMSAVRDTPCLFRGCSRGSPAMLVCVCPNGLCCLFFVCVVPS